MNNYDIGIPLILLLILIIIYCKNNKLNNNPVLKENYSLNIKPLYNQYNPVNESNYNMHYKTKLCQDFSDYTEMVVKLLNDLSNNSTSINEKDLIKKQDYHYIESEYIKEFLDKKITEMVKNKKYLHKNNDNKYEQFHTTDLIIDYYSVDSKDYNILKVVYMLANTLRTTYTLCIAYIKEKDDKLEIINTKISNSLDDKEYSNTFTKELPITDKYSEYSGIDLNIEADIPDDFK